MISANGGLPAHRYTPQVTPRWPRGSEPASLADQLLSWNPSGVSTRNAYFDLLHALYIQCGLPKERITAQVHYFLCHYQSRLE